MDMAQLQDIVREAMDTGNTLQSGIIAVLCGLMIGRYGQVLYFTVIALLLDLLIVPIGFSVYESDMDFSGVVDTGTDLVNSYIDNPKYVVVMAVFFLIATSIVFAIKSVIRR
ncbi:MAG: hypothetical protein EP347_02955 [Alphaproteobacteria bacterium]|nr:MAG: hypothetical protein EP347_02955 [Alphaproteobacteria bacterium]